LEHRVIELAWYGGLRTGPITGAGEIADFGAGLPEDRRALLEDAWVPNRNCVFAGIGAAHAEAMEAGPVVIGLNREEAEVFPDNSAAFLRAMNRLLEISTLSGVEVVSYTANLSKPEIASLGLEIGAPLDLFYSCYRSSSDQRMCGTCQSCVRVKRALKEAGAWEGIAGRFET
jgi:7-cyano-7-deazaguanine synthase